MPRCLSKYLCEDAAGAAGPRTTRLLCSTTCTLPRAEFHLLHWRPRRIKLKLIAHGITIGRLNLMKHELMLIVHKVLSGALDIAEQLQRGAVRNENAGERGAEQPDKLA